MYETEESLIRLHAGTDPSRLALVLSGRPGIDAAYVVRQVEGRRRMSVKVPSWAAVEGLRYPPRLSLEQCSGERAARYKADLAARLVPQGGVMADLTGGLGVDFSFLARRFRHAFYVERDAVLCALARHNFPLLGLPQAEVVEGEAAEVLSALPALDLLFLDPARRDGAGRKTVCIADCEPDVAALMPRLLDRSPLVMVKLSPMLDVSDAVRRLGCVDEVHIVASGGECKDLLLVARRGAAEPRVTACDDGRTFTFTAAEEADASPRYADDADRYLYEPGAALMKAGAFRLVAVRYGLRKLHPNSHLYTGPHRIADFPGRTFSVEGVSGFARRELRDFLAGISAANLTVRNFPAATADLRRRLRLREGGEVYLFATTFADGTHRLLRCRKA